MKEIFDENQIAIYYGSNADYLNVPPFHPSKVYKEYIFSTSEISSHENVAYDYVRNCLKLFELDKEHFDTSEWNPFKDIISTGDNVLIKPNFVLNENKNNPNGLYAVITHPSIIRVICDFAYIALQGNGTITIGECPNVNCDFEEILTQTQLQSIVNLYKEKLNFKIEVMDLRELRLKDFYDSRTRDSKSIDPLGYSIINLEKDSEIETLTNMSRLYGADFNRNEICNHHQQGKHEYCISNTFLNADVILSIPKLKTHRKAGISIAMKNFVGINGNKNFLAHYRIGTPDEGGDEFPQLTKDQKKVTSINRYLKDSLLTKSLPIYDKLYKLARTSYHMLTVVHPSSSIAGTIQSGNWCGNDTIWRMILDLNKIIIYSDKKGQICKTPQRKIFVIVDGIEAGEGEGPLEPDLIKCGLIACGSNPVAIDTILAQVMGYDYLKIPVLQNAYNIKSYPLTHFVPQDINVSTNLKELKQFKFKRPIGWRNDE